MENSSNGETYDIDLVQGNDDEVEVIEEHVLETHENSSDGFPTLFQQDVQSKPHIGMNFISEEDAYSYYNAYARKLGFGIRKGSIYHSKTKNCITVRKFLCAKQGYKEIDKRSVGKVLRPRRNIREGCKALMGIKLTEMGTWVVNLFCEEHTHDFVSPSKSANIRSHKKMSEATKSLISHFNMAHMGPSQISHTLTTLVGEGGMVVTQQDTRNYLKKTRKTNIKNECMNVIRYFMEKHTKDDGFFFEAELDEDYRMRSIFWADGRSRMTYQQFSDVLVFDTTYRTNAFSMPFAPFTGVNHHGQSILFGCALLADELEETFVWLFETWLKAMGGKHPVSIITDQCLSMGNAIKRVFPRSRHRFCLWHIGQNEIKNLLQIKLKHVDFEKDYNSIKYSQTTEECEDNWRKLVEEYELDDNSWLGHMYQIRRYWIPCYLKETFFAGMSTTQRSENMNSFFDGYVSYMTPLNDFVRKYDLALIHRRDQENHEDYMTQYTKPILWSKSSMESQAGELYTGHIFDKFQAEFKSAFACIAHKICQDDSLSTYEVNINHLNGESKNITHKVIFDELEETVSCSCKKFEFEGLLCMHALKVFQKVDLVKIPRRYILTRWTIEARYGHVCEVIEERNTDLSKDFQCVTPMMIWNVREAALKTIDLGIKSLEHFNIAMPALRDVVDKLAKLNICPTSLGSGSVQEDGINEIDDSLPFIPQLRVRIGDPEKVTTRGRPKQNYRILSSIEQCENKAKQRTCSYCGAKGHYMTTCPQKEDPKEKRAKRT